MNSEMYSLRVLSHGKVTDLSQGFDLGGKPFSIFVRPKTVTMEANVLVSCKCICDKEASDLPVPIGDWTPGAIVSLSPDAISLSDFDVYWGGCETI